MLFLRRLLAVPMGLGGLYAPYIVDPRADGAERTAMVIALALGCAALAVLLWRPWKSAGNGATPSAGPILGLVLTAVAATSLAPPTHAETASDRLTCTPSVLRLCPKEAAMLDREAATRCLFRHLSQASPACQAVVRGQPARSAAPRMQARL